MHRLRRYDALLSINSPKHHGEFKVKVMKKWGTKDLVRMGKIVSVDMILADQTVSFSFDLFDLICYQLLNIGSLMKNSLMFYLNHLSCLYSSGS
jgi:hypothetical protein